MNRHTSNASADANLLAPHRQVDHLANLMIETASFTHDDDCSGGKHPEHVLGVDAVDEELVTKGPEPLKRLSCQNKPRLGYLESRPVPRVLARRGHPPLVELFGADGADRYIIGPGTLEGAKSFPHVVAREG